MKRAIEKRLDEISSWDLDKGCRNIINQASPGNRRLKKKLRRMARKQIKKFFNKDID